MVLFSCNNTSGRGTELSHRVPHFYASSHGSSSLSNLKQMPSLCNVLVEGAPRQGCLRERSHQSGGVECERLREGDDDRVEQPRSRRDSHER